MHGTQKPVEAMRRPMENHAPMAVYEVHLGSWMRPLDGREFFGYREFAERLTEYADDE